MALEPTGKNCETVDVSLSRNRTDLCMWARHFYLNDHAASLIGWGKPKYSEKDLPIIALPITNWTSLISRFQSAVTSTRNHRLVSCLVCVLLDYV